MSEEDTLAERAVASPHWRWMPGMLTLEEIVPPAMTLGWDAARVLHADEREAVRVCTVLGKVRDIHATALPDLDDPCTLGGLLALVRSAWGDPFICAAVDNTGGAWWVDGWAESLRMSYLHSRVPGDLHDTEAEALVAALEAAP
ncbi:MAG: hypothetical protein QF848_15425 [Planctomycetota bacterium]|jgi:hypothetical protein|nr:hypothetical protein [Planctomycetota bacterium]